MKEIKNQDIETIIYLLDKNRKNTDEISLFLKSISVMISVCMGILITFFFKFHL